MNHSNNLIIRQRQRHLPKFYNWLDHRLVHQDYLKRLTANSCALYLFLLTVSDREGLSYYSDSGIKQRLSSDVDINAAREELINKDLLAYRAPFYQVLSLPEPKENLQSCQKKASSAEIKKLLNQYIGEK